MTIYNDSNYPCLVVTAASCIKKPLQPLPRDVVLQPEKRKNHNQIFA